MTKGPVQPQKRTQIKLGLPADLGSHEFKISVFTHKLSQKIIDYAQVLPNTPKARVQTRLILTPTNAKLLHKALGDTLAKYEERHGQIKVPPTLADQLFQSMKSGIPNGIDDNSVESDEDDVNE